MFKSFVSFSVPLSSKYSSLSLVLCPFPRKETHQVSRYLRRPVCGNSMRGNIQCLLYIRLGFHLVSFHARTPASCNTRRSENPHGISVGLLTGSCRPLIHACCNAYFETGRTSQGAVTFFTSIMPSRERMRVLPSRSRWLGEVK